MYPKINHQTNDSVFKSPRSNESNNNEIKQRRVMKWMQSTQEIPRMHLFDEILSKIIRNKRLEFMRIFLINLSSKFLSSNYGISQNYNEGRYKALISI